MFFINNTYNKQRVAIPTQRGMDNKQTNKYKNPLAYKLVRMMLHTKASKNPK